MIITTLYEYLLMDQEMKNIRLTLQYLNNKYVNISVSFFVRTRKNRKYENVEYNETIKNIDYDRKKFQFIIIFDKPETYITIPLKKDISFHERYERFPKTITELDENLKEIINKLQNL